MSRFSVRSVPPTVLSVFLTVFVISLLCIGARPAWSQSATAPEFGRLPDSARIVLMPLDVELFSVGAGGVAEPQAQWTDQATRHLRDSVRRREASLGVTLHETDLNDAEVVALNHLHGTVATAIALHHYVAPYALPTKEKRLEWHIGADTARLRDASGADYALFLYIRDSYATAERKVAIVLAAMLSVTMPGGIQTGYASLVDLRSGDIVWFNRLLRGTGDLREAEPAEESISALLDKFPR
jgi:hypothetical protein